MKDYYATLGVDRNATPEQIKKAYRKLAIQYHPDKTGGDPELNQKFTDLTEAYDTLSDPAKKQNGVHSKGWKTSSISIWEIFSVVEIEDLNLLKVLT